MWNFKKNVDAYILSSAQNNIISLEKSFSNTPINNICTCIAINGRIDLNIVSKCLNHLLLIDNGLRTNIIDDDGQIKQFFNEYCEEEFPFFDFSLTD